ncbi:hypothetical protein Clacol_003660 [Clathrus columnatus]|uniref:Rhomboid-type serine protease n=1 Tax=Clathrus columnatus TaxID=1419009 RepID=A0AAV5A7J6_9AGAM|nr:hypothetical protein Clacol_003660 [Clathrus columnatus]
MYNNSYLEHDESQGYTAAANDSAKQSSHAISMTLGYSEEGLIKPQLDNNDNDSQSYDFERPTFEAPTTLGDHSGPRSTSALEPLDFSDSDPLNPLPTGSTSTKGAQLWSKLTGKGPGNGRYPLSQRIENKRRGIGKQKYPLLTWALTLVMVAIFIYESVVNWKAQGTPFSFKPVVNPMLGPSTSALINLGARLLGSPSLGASGAIFGTIAVEWIDLIFHWKLLFRPLRRLVFLVIDLIIGVILGYVSETPTMTDIKLVQAAAFYHVFQQIQMISKHFFDITL